ncbi:hypothetical protein [Helicobacter sp. NHP22-001]|uniref:hypothetical protein n=1 Tax=Helicobacter sp. NHP22-001 TaxID=3040202 RepID=UPI00244D8182|nr:hypothetical protein [Helicobacter sp. NHP22-001]GMB96555.1 hypothetical protein NHP22001_11440 [Helicobacter sp. NHP22-001]
MSKTLKGLQIAYTKEGQEEVFNLAFPHTLENFEGIRDALIALLGEDAGVDAQNMHQNPQWGFGPMGFGPQAQSFDPHNPQGGFNPQGFGPQSGFNLQAQHPFSGYASFGAQGPQGATPQQGFNPQAQGFQGFGAQGMPFAPHGMFMFGFMPFWGFGPMDFHAQAPQWGFNPQGQIPQNGFDPQSPQQGFNPQNPQGGFGPQAQGFSPQHPQNRLTESAQAQQAQPRD